MSPLLVVVALLGAYLIGAIPFGYLIGRLRGVNLFEVGSGNIGATNAARVLGTPLGVLVFVLDFLKGALPVALVGSPDALRVAAAAMAFLGHLFPVYLGFRGGKGVATGAGTIFVLVPGPAALAVLFWVVVLLASRTVSLASLTAGTVLIAARLLGTPAAFDEQALPITLYVLIGTAFIFVKHRGNVMRLLSGTESASLSEGSRRQTALRTIHLLALGMWFGGAGFFNFVAAPAIFESFKHVVNAGPSDRTAYETIIAADAEKERKDALANALAGSAVGPVFPRYFAMQAICAGLALITALAWRRCAARVHRLRVIVIAAGLLTLAVGWPLSEHVSSIRVARFSPDPEIKQAAKEQFGPVHLASLGLSFVTVCLAAWALALAARLPETSPPVTESGDPSTPRG